LDVINLSRYIGSIRFSTQIQKVNLIRRTYKLFNIIFGMYALVILKFISLKQFSSFYMASASQSRSAWRRYIPVPLLQDSLILIHVSSWTP